MSARPGVKSMFTSHRHASYLFQMVTLLMLEMEYSGFVGNTMPVDALTPKVARTSADMVSAV